jgi:hypothetical protein
MSDLLTDKLSRWSLERVRFLLAHIESFVDDQDGDRELRERARAFVAQTGLEGIESLLENEPGDPRLPLLLLQRLAPFFDAGLLLQRGLSADDGDGNWWMTDLFWRGSTFHLELNDQVRANTLVPEITPLQVRRAPATKILSALNMDFLRTPGGSDGYLLRPAPGVCFVLFSDLAPPWAADHLAHAHRLINKSFLY